MTSTSTAKLDDKNKIQELDQDGIYKYVSVVEGDRIQHNATKEKSEN